MRSPLKNALANLLLLLGTLLVLLLVCEGVARLLLPPHPIYIHPQPVHDPDPLLRWVLRPAQQGFTQDRPMRVNGAGLRDDEEIPPHKPPGELRVLLLGDSFTFGNGVTTSETYAEVLERRLVAAGTQARVLNGGVQGYDTHSEADWLRQRGLALEPDAIVVGIYENDVTIRRPPRAEDQGGEAPGTGRWRSLVYAVKRLRSVVYLSSLVREARWRLRPPASNYHVRDFFFEDPSPESERAWRDVSASLASIRDTARERGVEVLLLLFPHRSQLVEGPLDRSYRARVLEVAAELGLQLVDLLPSYRSAAERGSSPYIAFDGHPNALGHELAGEALAEPVAALLARRRAAADAGR